MSPVLKKVIAGFAATKAIEKIQEVRRPRQSFVRRNAGKLLFVGLAGGIATYLFRSGKIDGLVGRDGSDGYRDQFPTGPGTQPIPAPGETRTLEPTGA